MTDILDRVRKVVCEHLGVDPNQVVPEVRFEPGDAGTADLGADSLDIVELTMAWEDEFKIEILDEDANNVATFADAVELVGRLVKEKAVA